MAMTIRKMRKWLWTLRWYPPYIGTGIRVKVNNEIATSYTITMKLRWYNRNIFGSHFGGSLYAMCDPWYAFAASAHFGRGYMIWDKSASIKYLKPGMGTVRADFAITNEKLANMKILVDEDKQRSFTFSTYILGEQGEKVAFVEKEIHIRKKIG